MAIKEHIISRLALLWLPVGEASMRVLMSVREGESVLQTIRKARSIEQLRMFWALMDIVQENDESYEHLTRYHVRHDVFEVIGEMETWTDRWGRTKSQPKSIAIESMPAPEFNDLMTRCINVVCQWLGTQPKEIQDQVYSIIADKRYDNNPRR